MEQEDKLLDTAAAAARASLEVRTIRVYLRRTRKRIAEGKPVRAHDFPVPDETFGVSPGWRESTIDRWLAARPGPGNWGTT